MSFLRRFVVLALGCIGARCSLMESYQKAQLDHIGAILELLKSEKSLFVEIRKHVLAPTGLKALGTFLVSRKHIRRYTLNSPLHIRNLKAAQEKLLITLNLAVSDQAAINQLEQAAAVTAEVLQQRDRLRQALSGEAVGKLFQSSLVGDHAHLLIKWNLFMQGDSWALSQADLSSHISLLVSQQMTVREDASKEVVFFSKDPPLEGTEELIVNIGDPPASPAVSDNEQGSIEVLYESFYDLGNLQEFTKSIVVVSDDEDGVLVDYSSI